MGKITVTTCEIDGLYEITPTVFEDARGGQWYAVRGEASVVFIMTTAKRLSFLK